MMTRACLVLLCALAACAGAASAQDAQLMDRAYAAIGSGDNATARPLIEAHLAGNPGDAQAWHQLAYVDEALKDYAAALVAVDRYLALVPGDDRARLERGYDLASAGRQDQATAQFAALRNSGDSEIAKQATAEWTARRATAQTAQGWDVFGYALSESRFSDTFFGVDARKSLRPGARLEPYAVLHYVGDVRSGSGQNAQIFSDNAAVSDLGVRMRIARGTYLFAEGGAGFGLRGGGTITDARYGLTSSQEWGSTRDGVTLDASVATYSRYGANTIGYLDARKTVPLGRTLSLLLGLDAGADTQRLYYNNFVQGVVGIQTGTPALKFRLEAYEGTYLSRGLGAPAKRTYWSLRPVMLFGFSR